MGGVRKDRPKTVFVSGSSKTQFKDSGYYRKQLPKAVKSELDMHIKRNNKIIVGDAPGVDRQVQNYLKKKNYMNVEIYGPGKKYGITRTRNGKQIQSMLQNMKRDLKNG